MKNKNPYRNISPVGCGTNIKTLVKHNEFLLEGREIVYDLIDSGLIPYEIQDQLVGNIEMSIRRNKQEIKNAKKKGN